MTVLLPNAVLGVRRVEPTAVDAHGSPEPVAPSAATSLLPGKATELDNGGWQMALDPTLWPVRVGDRVVGPAGTEWLITSSKYIDSPALSPEEVALGLDLDVAFVRVMAQQITAAGTEPTDGTLVGRVGSPV